MNFFLVGDRLLVSHEFSGSRVEKEIEREVGFLLTNKMGGFFNLGISSKYRGLFFRYKDDILKFIDDIRIEGDIEEIKNYYWCIQRKRGEIFENFFMPFGSDCLVYETNYETDIDVLFDVKRGYDNRVWGRNYKIYTEGGKIIVEFTKKTDSREDQSNGAIEYTIFLVINPESKQVMYPNNWIDEHYSFDERRKSYPNNRFVYDALKIKSKRLIITYSDKKDEAINKNNLIERNLHKLKELQKKYVQISSKEIEDKNMLIAYKCAVEALDGLLVNIGESVDLYAGLPWFFQFWGRDSLISLNGLILENEFADVKKILMRHLHKIEPDGLLPNRSPGTITKSADAIGWYFKRWDDFLTVLRRKKELKNYFKKSEILLLISKLEDCINNVFKNYTLDNLAMNGDQETWMDTMYDGDGRKGARIEIQALRLFMYDMLFSVTDNKIYEQMVDKLKVKVIESFWNGSYLKDGSDDPTIRPNLFIAAYIYPELLTNEEWTRCFENVLPELWLEWGGLSTIDKLSQDYYSRNTGEDSASYHRGDSWFWINNLAAIVLYRTNYKRFKKYIDKIIAASIEDILYSGFIGCHSEISGASSQESLGCLSQAWSNALFIELISEINDSKD